MIILRTKQFDEIENIQNILNGMKERGIGPGNSRYDKLAENLKNRQTINNSGLPKNTVITNNSGTTTGITKYTPSTPKSKPMTLKSRWNGLSKVSKAGVIGGTVLVGGLAAKSLLGNKKQ